MRIPPSPLAPIDTTPSSSPVSPQYPDSPYTTITKFFRANDLGEASTYIGKHLPLFENYAVEDLLNLSSRYNFALFKSRFSSPPKIDSAMERFFVKSFVHTLLPACGSFIELDGPNWHKGKVKEALAELWNTFTTRQHTLIHEELRSSETFSGITQGTLRTIAFLSK